jgi:hypothetical protein
MVGRFLRLNPRHMDQAVVMTKISFMGRPEPEQLKGDIIEYVSSKQRVWDRPRIYAHI